MATYWETWYKYLIVSMVFSHLGFWSGILFLIAPFPDLCLLVRLFLRIVFVLCNSALFRFVPQSIVIHTGIYKQRNETEQTFCW